MAHEVFISYSHKDKTVADAICNRLEADGIRCWYAPRDIEPGTEWGIEILKGIEAAKVMVLVFTKDANLSQQVLREVNNAVNYGLSIIPFRLTEEEPAAGMKYYLSTVHWMDAMNSELEESIHKLSDLCKAVLEKKPVPPTAEPDAVGKSASSASAVAAAAGTAKKKKRVFPILALSLLGIIAVVVIVVAVWFINLFRDIDDPYSDSQEAEVTYDESVESVEEESNIESDIDDSGVSTEVEHFETNYESLGAISENVNTDLSDTYTKGNNQGNLQNGGYLAYDGEYYYYASNDGMKMFRMKEDGSDKKQLTDSGVRAISVIDGYIYFVLEGEGYYKMKTDGTDMELITDEYYDYTSRIIGDRIYSCEYGISSVALDGSDYIETVDDTGYYAVLDGTYVYYSDPSDSGKLYRRLMEGGKKECIYDHYVLSLRIAGNYLFFYDSDDGYEMAYDLTTGEATQLFADPANDPVVTEDGIYGPSGQLVLTFTPFSGMGMKVYTEQWVSVVNVAGNKIFYHNDEEEKYYIVDLDGSNLMET